MQRAAIVETMVVFNSILQPAGPVARQELDLILTATWLMLIVVIPVFLLTAWISWRYRAGNQKATYTPDWDHSRLAESIWWGFPLLIILILSVVTWQSTHQLDPFRPLNTANTANAQAAPLKVQVIALEWKWLFIYPEQNVATVNMLHIPVDTPVDFEITADAPMNSFWIPSLGGQIYAMAGMSTQLHLLAEKPGIYNGSSANLSGEGFAGMQFKVVAEPDQAFRQWTAEIKHAALPLDWQIYANLAAPSKDNQTAYYAPVTHGLYHGVVMRYTPHGHHASEEYTAL